MLFVASTRVRLLLLHLLRSLSLILALVVVYGCESFFIRRNELGKTYELCLYTHLYDAAFPLTFAVAKRLFLFRSLPFYLKLEGLSRSSVITRPILNLFEASSFS